MTANKAELVSAVEKQMDDLFGIQLKSLEKLTVSDLELLNNRMQRLRERPEETISMLARRRVRERVDNLKNRTKAHIFEKVESFMDNI